MNRIQRAPNHATSEGLGQYRKDIAMCTLLPAADEQRLTEQLACGDEQAKRRLIEAHLRLVVYLARSYAGQGLDLSDLIQEGNLGLMQAVEKFDPARGYRLTTYASRWIRQAMLRALTEQSHTIRLSAHKMRQRSQLTQLCQHLFEESGHEPTEEQLAEHLNMPVIRVRQLLAARPSMVDLDTLVDEREALTLADTIEDEQLGSLEEAYCQREAQLQLYTSLAHLPRRERTVIILHYGLDGTKCRTLAEIGGMLGITLERVRQLEVRALRLLRRQLRNASFDAPFRADRECNGGKGTA